VLKKKILINQDSFSYRHNHFVEKGDVIYQARLEHMGIDPLISKKIRDYLEMRTRSQPLKEWTCGCVFKNAINQESGVTCRAGHFIDIMGLKGLTFKNLMISPKHANFMENRGESSSDDVLKFVDIIKKELKLHTGVSFQTEVEY